MAWLLWDSQLSCGAPRVLLMAAATALLLVAGWAAAPARPRLQRALLALGASAAFFLPLLEALALGAWRPARIPSAPSQEDWKAQLRENRLASLGPRIVHKPLLHSYGAMGETREVALLNRLLRAGSVDRDNMLSLMGVGGWMGEDGKLNRWKSPVRAALVGSARQRGTGRDFLRLALQPFHMRPLILEQAHPDLESEAQSASWTLLRIEPRPGQGSVIALPEGHQGGWLYFSDSYYPGWAAKVDGKPSPILLAEQAFRAVRVFSGDRLVEFSYRPASFGAGLGISLLALVFLALSARKAKEAPR